MTLMNDKEIKKAYNEGRIDKKEYNRLFKKLEVIMPLPIKDKRTFDEKQIQALHDIRDVIIKGLNKREAPAKLISEASSKISAMIADQSGAIVKIIDKMGDRMNDLKPEPIKKYVGRITKRDENGDMELIEIEVIR